MSRFYELSLYKPTQALTEKPFRQWSSFPNGVFNSSAANVEFDIPILPYDTPTGGQVISIEGVSLADLQQNQGFAGMYCELKGGMGKGLPLANAKQSGTLMKGFIYQVYANWEGTEMTLDFVIYPSPYLMDNNANISFSWTAGTTLQSALVTSLYASFPGMPINLSMVDIIQPHTESGHYSTIEQFAIAIASITKGMGNKVSIVMQNGEINIYDTKYKEPSNALPITIVKPSPKTPEIPKQINPVDLVGQPTWIKPGVMQVKLIMRGDLAVGKSILMPKGFMNAPGFVLTQASSYPSAMKYESAFQGTFQINGLRHVGNFRSPNGNEWVTIAECLTNG